jgi:hypothetical protein
MNNRKLRRSYIPGLTIGTADIFFILLAFFLTLGTPRDIAQRKVLFKLPLTAEEKQPPQKEFSLWRVKVPTSYRDTLLILESVEGDSIVQMLPFVVERAASEIVAYDTLKALFDEFIRREAARGVESDSIRVFDIFAYYGSPCGIVFTAIDICKELGRQSSLIYEKKIMRRK